MSSFLTFRNLAFLLCFGAAFSLSLFSPPAVKDARAVDECGIPAAGTTRFSAYASGTTYRIGMLVRSGTSIHRKTSAGTGAPGATAQNGWSAPLTAGTGYAAREILCDSSDTGTTPYDETITYEGISHGATALIFELTPDELSESIKIDATAAELYMRPNTQVAWTRNERGHLLLPVITTITADLQTDGGSVPITVIAEEGSSIMMDLTDPTGGIRSTARHGFQGPTALYVSGGLADESTAGGPDIYLDLAGSIVSRVTPIERADGVFASTKAAGNVHVNLLGSVTADIAGMTLASRNGDIQFEFFPTASISVGNIFATLEDAEGFFSSGINAQTHGSGSVNLNLRGGTITAVGAESIGVRAETAFESTGDINVNVRDTQISLNRGAVTTNIDTTSDRGGSNAILARGIGSGAVNIIVSGNARLTNSDEMGGGGSNVYVVTTSLPSQTMPDLANEFAGAPIDICIGEKNAGGDCISGTSMPVLTATGAGISNVRYSAVRNGDVRVDLMTGIFQTSGANSDNVRGYSGRRTSAFGAEGGKGDVNINIDGASLTTTGDSSHNVEAFAFRNGDDGDIAVNIRNAQLVARGASFNINMSSRSAGGSTGGGNLDVTLQSGAMLTSAGGSIAMVTLSMDRRAMVNVMEGAMISAASRAITMATHPDAPNAVVNRGTIRGGMAFRSGTNTITNHGTIEGWFCSNDRLAVSEPQCHTAATPFGMEGMTNAGRVALTNMQGSTLTLTRPMTLGADTTITMMSGSTLVFAGASMTVGGMEMRTAGRLDLGANPASLDIQGGTTIRVLGVDTDAQGNVMPVIDADNPVTLPPPTGTHLVFDFFTETSGSIRQFPLFSDSAMGALPADRNDFIDSIVQHTIMGGSFDPATRILHVIHSDERSLRTYDTLFQSAWHSDRALSRQLFKGECQTSEETPEPLCSWFRVSGRFTRHNNTNSLDYGEDATTFLVGGNMKLPQYDAFYSVGYERGDFNIKSGTATDPEYSSTAHRFLFAVGAKGQGRGPLEGYDWDAQLRAGYTDYDVARRARAGGIIYRGTPELGSVSLAAGLARTFDMNSGFLAKLGDWKITPRAEMGFIHMAVDKFTENSSGNPLVIPSTDMTLAYASASANAVYETQNNEGSILKTQLQFGIDAFMNDPETDWNATVAFLNLSTKGTMEQAFLDLGLAFGFEPTGITGISFEVGYDGNFSPDGDTQVHRASARFNYAF